MTPDNPAPSVMPAYYAQAPQNRSAHGAGARVHAPPDGELPDGLGGRRFVFIDEFFDEFLRFPYCRGSLSGSHLTVPGW